MSAETELLLLHGWGFDRSVWGDFMQTGINGMHFSSINVPGYGENVSTGKNLQDIADLLYEQVLDNTVLFGWSLGGQVAIRLAGMRGASTRGLILLSTNPCFVQKEDWPFGVDEDHVSEMRAGLQKDHVAVVRGFIGWCAQGDISPRRTMRRLQSISDGTHLSAQSLDTGLGLLLNTDLRNELADLRCPVLMLFADKDRIVPVDAAEPCAAMLHDGRVRVLERAGHAPLIARPEAVHKHVHEFLQGI